MKRLLLTTAYAAAITAFALTFSAEAKNNKGSSSESNSIAIAGASASSTVTATQNQNQTTSINSGASSAIAGSVSGNGPCNVGFGIGLSEFTGSISTGISWQNVPCVVLQEAVAFYNMGLRTEAITHLAAYHRRMGPTLRRTGAVVSPTEPATSSKSVTNHVTTAGVQSNNFSR